MAPVARPVPQRLEKLRADDFASNGFDSVETDTFAVGVADSAKLAKIVLLGGGEGT